jgi:pSer/pThr/pTyr-binding forkhead associated (FHA) protein
MSGDHARLELQNDEWILRDLNSTNGTFVNGFEVRDATSVNAGDIIRVGRVELRLMTT